MHIYAHLIIIDFDWINFGYVNKSKDFAIKISCLNSTGFNNYLISTLKNEFIV